MVILDLLVVRHAARHGQIHAPPTTAAARAEVGLGDGHAENERETARAQVSLQGPAPRQLHDGGWKRVPHRLRPVDLVCK